MSTDPASTATTTNPLEALSRDNDNNSTNADALVATLTASVIATLESKLTAHASATESHIIAQVNGLVTDRNGELTERAAKRFEEDSAAHIVDPDNKEQYTLNNSILRLVDKAANAIVAGDADAALTTLSEGKKILKSRQKLVLLADSEPYGWDFVREYTKKSLAADSDDEKAFVRIRRTLKAKLDETRRQDNMVRASNSPSNNNNNTGRSRSGDFARARRQSPFHFQDRRRDQDDRRTLRTYRDGQRTTPHHRETRTDFRRDRYDRYCYTCNRRGHLSFDCPEQ